MTICTFFDKATGAVTGNADISDETVAANRAVGIGVIEGEAVGADTHYVDLTQTAPALVQFTDAELTERANLKPGWIFKMPERVAFDPRALAQAKAQARRRINAARDVAEHAPFTCAGLVYDGDAKATARITGAVALAMAAGMAGIPFSREWTLLDNTKTMLDGPAMMAVGAALGEKVGAVFDTASALKEQIEAATTAAQADAINWPEA